MMWTAHPQFTATPDMTFWTKDFSVEMDSLKLYYAGEVPEGWSGLSCGQLADYLLSGYMRFGTKHGFLR